MGTPAKKVAFNCPNCHVRLREFEAEPGVTVSLCRECKGMWHRAGQLAKLTGAPKDFPGTPVDFRDALHTEAHCPDCNGELFRVTYTDTGKTEVDWCIDCHGIWLDRARMEQIQRELVRERMSSAKVDALIEEEEAEEKPSSTLPKFLAEAKDEPYQFESPLITMAALPATCLMIPILKFLWLPAFFLDFFPMQFHELGHAVAAWLGGHFAMPIFYGETVWSETSSVGLYAGGVLFWSIVGLLALRFNAKFSALLCLLFIGAATCVTFGLPVRDSEQFRIWNGVGGQFWLSAIVILAFFYDMPTAIRWDFWRFPALLVSVYTFIDSWDIWRRIAGGRIPFPVGSLLQGSDDKSGDMNRLLGEFGMSTHDISRSYLHLAAWCAAVLVVHYLYFAINAFYEYNRNRPSPATSDESADQN
jgi:Zn-finger nucleic acid-binding protein